MAEDHVQEARAQDGADPALLDSLPKWLRDFIELNYETAGLESGRVKRFGADEHGNGPQSAKRRDERSFNRLLLLLQDPNYARLYRETINDMTRLSDAAEKALRKIGRQMEIAERHLQYVRDAAVELPGGRKVFLSKNGRLYAEDGTDVTEQRNTLSGEPQETPSWEHYQRVKDSIADIARQREEVETYQREVIEPANERLGDIENAPDSDELGHIKESLKAPPPAAVRAELEQATPPRNPAANIAEPSGLNAPDMDAQFAKARAVAVELPPTAAQTLPTNRR